MTERTETTTPARIVVGIDGSPGAEHALRWAARLAESLPGVIEAVNAWQVPLGSANIAIPYGLDPQQDARDTLARTAKAVFGTDQPDGVRLIVRQGYPAKELIDHATEATLLVVGSRGHGGFAGLLLGSVSSHVAAHARCPVLVVHGDELPPARRTAP